MKRATSHTPAGPDLISVVEAAWDLAADEQGWLERLVELSAPSFDRGFGVVGFTFSLDPDGRLVHGVEASFARDPRVTASMRRMSAEAPARAVEMIFLAAGPYCTLSERMAALADEDRRFFDRSEQEGFKDGVGLRVFDGVSAGVTFGGPMPKQGSTTRQERARWSTVAMHVGAAQRLRRALARPALDDPSVEAVLLPSGRLLEARGDAANGGARERLRASVRAVDAARGAMRRDDPDGALRVWTGMVAGTWSLVDHFDTDGRRFVVARRNAPGAEDPRGLSAREQQVVSLIVQGCSNKLVGYALGLTPSTVATHLASAMKKLSARTRADLLRLAPLFSGRARRAQIDVGGDRLDVLALDPLDPAAQARLSAAEREVSALAVQGLGNEEIARRRGTTARTVANQLASTYEKLGVSSRSELAVALQRGAKRLVSTN